MIHFATYDSPFGLIEIGYENGFLLSIRRAATKTRHDPSALSDLANMQLQEYFEGKRTSFDLPSCQRAHPSSWLSGNVCWRFPMERFKLTVK